MAQADDNIAQDVKSIWSEFAPFSGSTTQLLRSIEGLLQKLVETARQASGGEVPGPPPAANPESVGGSAGGGVSAGSASSAAGAAGGTKREKSGGGSPWKRSVSSAFGRGIAAAGNPLALQSRAALDIEADLTTAAASAFGGERFAEVVGALKRNAGGSALNERLQDLTLQDTQGLAVNFARHGISADEAFYRGASKTFESIRQRENEELVKATRATDANFGGSAVGVASVATDQLQALQKIQDLVRSGVEALSRGNKAGAATPGVSE